MKQGGETGHVFFSVRTMRKTLQLECSSLDNGQRTQAAQGGGGFFAVDHAEERGHLPASPNLGELTWPCSSPGYREWCPLHAAHCPEPRPLLTACSLLHGLSTLLERFLTLVQRSFRRACLCVPGVGARAAVPEGFALIETGSGRSPG